MSEKAYEGWAVVELFGHKRHAGLVSEATIAGGAFLRIDVPEVNGHGASTHFFGAAALYGIHPTSEEIARAIAAKSRPEPVSRYELPQLKAAASEEDPDGDVDEDDADLGDPEEAEGF